MAKRIDTLAFRRKREGKTHYRTRLKLLESGETRLVIRKSLKNIIAQLVQYSPSGDHVITTATSMELSNYGWKLHGSNIMGAYLVGMLIAQKAKQKNISAAVFDIGQQASTKGSRIYAALKGALDGGLKIPHGEAILPAPERLMGKHIEQYAQKAKGFQKYKATNVDPTKVSKHVEEVKQQIMKA